LCFQWGDQQLFGNNIPPLFGFSPFFFPPKNKEVSFCLLRGWLNPFYGGPQPTIGLLCVHPPPPPPSRFFAKRGFFFWVFGARHARMGFSSFFSRGAPLLPVVLALSPLFCWLFLFFYTNTCFLPSGRTPTTFSIFFFFFQTHHTPKISWCFRGFLGPAPPLPHLRQGQTPKNKFFLLIPTQRFLFVFELDGVTTFPLGWFALPPPGTLLFPSWVYSSSKTLFFSICPKNTWEGKKFFFWGPHWRELWTNFYQPPPPPFAQFPGFFALFFVVGLHQTAFCQFSRVFPQ